MTNNQQPPARETVPFTFDGAEIRTLIVNYELWWVATDICSVLDISNARDAVGALDNDEVNQVPVATTDGSGRSLPTNIVNESGLYSLIFRSRKPEAKAFKRWVTHEVLPAIRRTGRYEHLGAPRPAGEPRPVTVTQINMVRKKIDTLARGADLGLVHPSDFKRQGLHLLASIGLAEEPPAIERERFEAVLRWIRRHYEVGETFSLRTTWQGVRGQVWCNDTEDAAEILGELAAAGHIRPLPPPPRKRGRPPSPRFEVLKPPARLQAVPDTTGGAR